MKPLYKAMVFAAALAKAAAIYSRTEPPQSVSAQDIADLVGNERNAQELSHDLANEEVQAVHEGIQVRIDAHLNEASIILDGPLAFATRGFGENFYARLDNGQWLYATDELVFFADPAPDDGKMIIPRGAGFHRITPGADGYRASVSISEFRLDPQGRFTPEDERVARGRIPALTWAPEDH